jgi:hypothetical protein
MRSYLKNKVKRAGSMVECSSSKFKVPCQNPVLPKKKRKAYEGNFIGEVKYAKDFLFKILQLHI